MAVYGYTRPTNTSPSAIAASSFDFLEGQLSQHGAWSKAATVTSGSTVASVWKNSGTRNAFGQDFHLLLFKTAGATVVGACEAFNPTNNTVIRPVPNNTSANTMAPSGDGSYGGTAEFPLLSGASIGGDLQTHPLYLSTVAGNPFELWVNITNNTFTVWGRHSFSAASARYSHIGVFESFLAPDPFPLVMSGSAGPDRGLSRFPYVSAAQSGNWSMAADAMASNWTTLSGTLNGAGDRLHNSRPVASRALVNHVTSTISETTHGNLRGLLRAVLIVRGTTNPAAALGDTVVLNGDVYAVVSSGSTTTLVNTSAP